MMSCYGVLLRDGRRDGVISEVVGVRSVGRVPDCSVDVLRWPMRGEIFCW